MKIWIVNHYAAPPDRFGVTRTHSYARELLRLGHDVTVIAASFDHVAGRETRLGPGERTRRMLESGVPFLWLRTPPVSDRPKERLLNVLGFARAVVREVGKRLEGPPDVVIGSSPHLLGALAAERLADRYGVPFVLEVQDLWPKSLVEFGTLSAYHPLNGMLSLIERYLYHHSSAILTALPAAAGHMIAKGASGKAIVWLPNGVDVARLPPPRPPRDDATPFTLMYAGSHGLPNGLDVILDAAGMLQADGWGDRVRIRLVGDGPEKPRLRKRAQVEGLLDVVFETPVAKSAIIERLSEADAFIATLRASGLYQYGISPNKLFDYMAAARPTILGVDAANNPIADGEAGLTVPPEDPRALADAIKQLVQLPIAERLEMGLRARRHVEAHYGFGALGERMEAVLLGLVPAPE